MITKVLFLVCFSVLQNVFSQQLAPGQLKQKVDEIAKAYAEGYKAAITALSTRNMIPKRPLAINNKQPVKQRSFIPKPYNSHIIQNGPAVSANGFPFASRQITVNGVEKSGIPKPQYRDQIPRAAIQRNSFQPAGHTVVARSAAPPPLLGRFMDQQMGRQTTSQMINKRTSIPQVKGGATIPDESKALEMAKLNAAARHRNVYFDAMGGDPYGGASAVLSHQHVQLQRNRRSLEGRYLRSHIRRHRRSRMPYLGQDLDKLGIVRAVPVFNSPGKQQDSALPSFMKVHSAEFGSLNGQSDNSLTSRKSSVVQPMMTQQAGNMQMMYRVLRR